MLFLALAKCRASERGCARCMQHEVCSQMPMSALGSRRFEDGAEKCGRDNWKKGIPLSDTLIVSTASVGFHGRR